jgi:hypothetical protein
MHAGMRRIDLTCLIASPIMAGALLQFGGLRAAILGILAWNLAAWLPECLLLTYAQRCSPALRCAAAVPALCCGDFKISVGDECAMNCSFSEGK